MKKHYNSKGFTLIEILLSLAILSIIIVPISSFFLSSQKISRDSDIKFRAISLAQNYFEQIKSMDFETIESIEGIEWIGEFDPSSAINGESINEDFKIEINIVPVKPDGNEEKYKKDKATNNIDDIEYAMKIVVNNHNSANIYESDDLFLGLINNIGNELGITFEEEELKITPKNITLNNLDEPKINIRIELYANMSFEIFNKSENGQTLVFYINKQKENVNCILNVKKGKVEKHESIDLDETTKPTDYILYEVNIKVYDKNEDNLIEDNIITELNGYKSIY